MTSAFADLFGIYTSEPDSIGAHLGDAAAQATADEPLIVVTGTDVAFFPGGGAPPAVEPYRLTTRGFRELAAVSHLGPALATLAELRARDGDGPWRADALRLLHRCAAARAANGEQLWADLAVPAFTGREPSIAAMIDYSCALTGRILERALDRPGCFTITDLERDYLDGPGADLPVPFNRVMIATFFLTGMDVAHRLIAWFDALDIAWEHAMVIAAGQVGRPTAGVTRESHSIVGVVLMAARGRLAPDRVYIAPHAQAFPAFDGRDTSAARAYEPRYRRLWASLRAVSELGGRMFAGYPPTPDDVGLAKPAVAAPDDWLALVGRLRMVMEDPRQLLSSAVTDYAADRLIATGNDPTAVIVPGLDGEAYP